MFVIALFIAAIAKASAWFRLDRDATFWIAAGVVLLVLTLVRPWWFWYHPKALLVRTLLTDRGAILLYLGITIAIIVIGVTRQMAIARARAECVRLLAEAKDVHERVRVLYGHGVTNLPHNDDEPRAFTCGRLLEDP